MSEVAGTEIRFAVVLNGGVSLAVWMGGVVLELDQLIRQGGPYGGLMGLLGVTARADVISGTSAGGINGAALALSQVNHNADVSMLREMWAEQGRMETLLQRPFKGAPASLLRGDDYFLPKLTEAMDRLTRDWSPAPVEQRPIDLTITTTLLEGARTVTVDALGQLLPQMRHEGRFRFRRGTGHTRDGSSYDDFSAAGERGRPSKPQDRLAERLALAARCTASFPAAFEPVLVPVEKGATDDQTKRVDMLHHVNWATAGARQRVPDDRSRFAVDGGALANTPTRDALEAIQRMPADHQVDRVMLLVYPHAPPAPPDRGEPAPDLTPPTVTGTFGSLLGALLSQGSRTFVDEIETHNQRAAARRATRTDILDACHAGGLDTLGSTDRAEVLFDLARRRLRSNASWSEILEVHSADAKTVRSLYRRAEMLFDLYRGLRLRRAARDLSMRVQTPDQWSFERIRSAVEEAHRTFAPNPASPPEPRLPYVPDTLPVTQPGNESTGWGWGTSAALDIADAALDLVQRLPANRGADGARKRIHEAMAVMRTARDTVDRRWDRHEVLIQLEPDATYWQLRLATYSWLMLRRPEDADQVRILAERLVAMREQPSAKDARAIVRAARDDTSDASPATAAQDAVEGSFPGQDTRRAVDDVVRAVGDVTHLLNGSTEPAWRSVFGEEALPTDPAARRQAILDRLLWLHVASWTVGDETGTENTRPVRLVQISAQTSNAFASQSVTMDEKLGGADIARFSGFLKRSWRMNDWAWGRCDAATMLCRVVLSPERVRPLVAEECGGGDNAEQIAGRVVDRVLRSTFGLANEVDLARWKDESGALWAPVVAQRQRAIEEVAKLLADQGTDSAGHVPTPASLPELAALAAYPRHLQIAIEELPVIAAAVQADAMDGANKQSRGQLLLNQHEQLLNQLGTASSTGVSTAPATPVSPTDAHTRHVDLGLRALSAFDGAGIGREPLGREGTSDQMIRTATTAASVGVTLLDSPRSGLGVLKPVTRLLRGAMLVPYWITLGLTGGGRIARFLALLALSTGGLLLALAVFGVLPGWATGIAAAAGAAAVLTAFGYAALRTGTLLHGLVLLTPVIALLALAWWLLERESSDADQTESIVTALGAIGTVGLLGLGLVALASLPAPMRSVQASFLLLVSPIAHTFLVAVGAAALVAMGLAVWPSVPAWAVYLGAVLLAVLGVVTAVHNGRELRLLRRHADGPAGRPWWRAEPVQHPLGVSAGWSALYGTGYLAGAVVVARVSWPPGSDHLRDAVLATTIAFAVVLLGVVPPVARHRAVRQLRAGLLAEVEAGLLKRRDVDADALVGLLIRRDLTYQCLVEPTDLTQDPRTAPGLELTRPGRQLAEALVAAADRTSGADRSAAASRS